MQRVELLEGVDGGPCVVGLELLEGVGELVGGDGVGLLEPGEAVFVGVLVVVVVFVLSRRAVMPSMLSSVSSASSPIAAAL